MTLNEVALEQAHRAIYHERPEYTCDPPDYEHRRMEFDEYRLRKPGMYSFSRQRIRTGITAYLAEVDIEASMEAFHLASRHLGYQKCNQAWKRLGDEEDRIIESCEMAVGATRRALYAAIGYEVGE